MIDDPEEEAWQDLANKSVAVNSTSGDILQVREQTSEEVIRIAPTGQLFWRGREVETDDAFRGAMLDLAKAMKSNIMWPTELLQLRAFAKDVMGDWPEIGSLDGFELQELAIKHGLLEATTQYKPCVEEGCFCAGMLTPEEFESGVTCYRRTVVLKGA